MRNHNKIENDFVNKLCVCECMRESDLRAKFLFAITNNTKREINFSLIYRTYIPNLIKVFQLFLR